MFYISIFLLSAGQMSLLSRQWKDLEREAMGLAPFEESEDEYQPHKGKLRQKVRCSMISNALTDTWM